MIGRGGMLEPPSFSPSSTPSPESGGKPADGLAQLKPRPTRLIRYGAAAVLVLVAFVLRLALFGHLDNRLPFAFFLPAAMIAAWYGGMGPGLLAAASGLLLGDVFFLPPHDAFGPLGDAERTVITVYAISSTLAVMLMESLHVKIRRLERELGKGRAGDQDPAA